MGLTLQKFAYIINFSIFFILLQGFMVVDHQLQHGSRHMLDHDRDMRLDIDDMSYEVNVTKHLSLFKPFA